MQVLRFHVFLTRQHLICIAPDGVDFSVMYNKAVWMGTLPAGIGVGGKAGMHHGNRRLIISILQIGKKGPKLVYQKHPFIYNGPAG